MFCNVLGLFFNKRSYSGEHVHEFCFTLYIAYEEAAYGSQDSARVVVSKINSGDGGGDGGGGGGDDDDDDDDDDIAYTGECLLPFVLES
jgi:hypothetical protein